MIELLAMIEACAPDVHPTTMMAIVEQESSGNPYAIGINDGRRLPNMPADRAEAIQTAQALLDQGRNFDSGLGQINSTNMEWLGLQVADLFDPCANLEAAATVLDECYGRAVKQYSEAQIALQAALSCYNTGTFHRGHENGYVQKVASRVPAASVPALQPVRNNTGDNAVTLAAVKGNNDNHSVKEERGAEGVQDVFSASLGDAFTNPKSAAKELAGVKGGLP